MTTATVPGILQSGGTSTHIGIADVLINVFQAGGDPQPVGQTRTENDGTFLVNVNASGGGIFYAVAELGRGVILTTIMGPSLVTPITINELTTVAAAFCFAQFIHHGKIGGPELGLSIAAGMNNNLVTPGKGESSPILLSPPNGTKQTHFGPHAHWPTCFPFASCEQPRPIVGLGDFGQGLSSNLHFRPFNSSKALTLRQRSGGEISEF